MAKRRQTRFKKPTTYAHKTFMGVIIAAVLLILVALFIARPPAPATSETTTNSPLQQDATTLYLIYCSACHGGRGEGYRQPNALPLNSTGKVWEYSDEQIVDIITNGVNEMPGYHNSLNDDQINILIDHIKSWWSPEQRVAQPGTAKG